MTWPVAARFVLGALDVDIEVIGPDGGPSLPVGFGIVVDLMRPASAAMRRLDLIALCGNTSGGLASAETQAAMARVFGGADWGGDQTAPHFDPAHPSSPFNGLVVIGRRELSLDKKCGRVGRYGKSGGVGPFRYGGRM